MNIQAISYFVDIAKHGSFSEAALRNHVSLPAVSQAIKRLEQELGFPLFLHGKNKYALSPQGELFGPQAERLLHTWQEMKEIDVAGVATRGEKQTISLVAPSSLYSSVYLEKLTPLCLGHKYHLRLFTGSSRTIRNLLEDRTCDFAICLDDSFLRNFASQSLLKGQFGLYQRKNCKNKDSLIIGDFGLEVREFTNYYREKFGRHAPIIAEVASWDLIAQMVEKGAGQGLLPDFHKVTRNKEVVKVHKDFPSVEYEIKVYAHANSSSRLMNFLISTLVS